MAPCSQPSMKMDKLGEEDLLTTEPDFQALIALNVGVESENGHSSTLFMHKDDLGKKTGLSGGISLAEIVDILAHSDF